MGPGRAFRVRGLEDVFRKLTNSSSTHPEAKKTKSEGSLLLLTTTGPAAEEWGDVFGLYREAGLYNGVRFYRQVDRSNKGWFMYQYSKYGWYIGATLGGDLGALGNLISSDTVPVSGWQYWDGKVWLHDENIRVTPV